jgi:prepilin-type N-terminal cleavage/methylation domain-containing protein
MGSRFRRGMSLVEILIVVCIIAVLGSLLLSRVIGGGKDKYGNTIQSPMTKAKGTECLSNLNQWRQAYKMATMTGEEEKPRTLQEFGRGFPTSMYKCPVGKQPIQFDPQTGRIWCSTPGHERN